MSTKNSDERDGEIRKDRDAYDVLVGGGVDPTAHNTMHASTDLPEHDVLVEYPTAIFAIPGGVGYRSLNDTSVWLCGREGC